MSNGGWSAEIQGSPSLMRNQSTIPGPVGEWSDLSLPLLLSPRPP